MQKKAKKYALIGTSCIGKTTLIEDLFVLIPQKLNKKVELSPERSPLLF